MGEEGSWNGGGDGDGYGDGDDDDDDDDHCHHNSCYGLEEAKISATSNLSIYSLKKKG